MPKGKDHKRLRTAGKSPPAEEALSILKPMTVAQRAQQIRTDIDTGERRFANVDVFDLAALLDVPQPERPAV
jgi:hypothetical protein